MTKNQKNFAAIAGAALIAAAFAPAGAQAADRGINARQHYQHERIVQGVHSGSLTKEEARGLVSQQRAIRKEERQFKSDGVMTRSERQDLHQDLNAASRNIYNEKHDGESL